MPVLSNSSSLLNAVMNELRIPVSNLTERTKITAQMSYVYGDICAKQDWWWLRFKTVINTNPRIDSGTVSLTENGTAVTFSTAPQLYSANVSVQDSMLLVQGSTPDGQAAYGIVQHTLGATTATLDGPFTGATGTAYAFRIHAVSYPLPADCGKLLHVNRYGYQEPLRKLGLEEITYLYQTNWQQGRPQAYSIYDFTTNNTVASTRRLQIYPYPDQQYRMEVWYKAQQVGDLSDLVLPVDFQQVLVYGTLSRCYAIFLNDLERSQYFLGLFNDLMALMAAQQREYASDHPGIQVAMDLYRPNRSSRRVHRSLGSLFDILPNVP